MEQHPIPRQITSFEFKLIGFMTLRQFLYLVIFFPIGFIVYKLTPISYINIALGVLVGSVGLLFAFVPIQDRPIEVWIRNFIKRMNSPSQYFYRKHNDVIYFLNNLYFTSDPHLAISHVETREKLNEYMEGKKEMEDLTRDKQKNHIDDLLKHSTTLKQQVLDQQGNLRSSSSANQTISDSLDDESFSIKKPFVTGVVKNRRQIPLPGILVSIKNPQGEELRLLKTNPHGVFATYSLLPNGNYMVEFSDPNDSYFFDTINLHIENDHPPSMTVYSKEIL